MGLWITVFTDTLRGNVGENQRGAQLVAATYAHTVVIESTHEHMR